jgi:6-phosphogluconolactonase/glucosamine-6-phosphate isomerase/deaminase
VTHVDTLETAHQPGVRPVSEAVTHRHHEVTDDTESDRCGRTEQTGRLKRVELALQVASGWPESRPVPRFDLILAGIGLDGHGASLVPRTGALHEKRRWVVAKHARIDY